MNDEWYLLILEVQFRCVIKTLEWAYTNGNLILNSLLLYIALYSK